MYELKEMVFGRRKISDCGLFKTTIKVVDGELWTFIYYIHNLDYISWWETDNKDVNITVDVDLFYESNDNIY